MIPWPVLGNALQRTTQNAFRVVSDVCMGGANAERCAQERDGLTIVPVTRIHKFPGVWIHRSLVAAAGVAILAVEMKTTVKVNDVVIKRPHEIAAANALPAVYAWVRARAPALATGGIWLTGETHQVIRRAISYARTTSPWTRIIIFLAARVAFPNPSLFKC